MLVFQCYNKTTVKVKASYLVVPANSLESLNYHVDYSRLLRGLVTEVDIVVRKFYKSLHPGLGILSFSKPYDSYEPSRPRRAINLKTDTNCIAR